MEYRHTQFGTLIVIGLLTPMIAIFIVPIVIGVFPPVLYVVLLLIVLSLAVFGALTVTVSSGTIVCSFGIGLVRRRISLSDVLEARVVRNPWYAGWGIRWIPGQYVLWNVSGLDAVELVFTNGSRFRIGTDEPDALLNAIELNRKLTA